MSNRNVVPPDHQENYCLLWSVAKLSLVDLDRKWKI